MRDIRGFKGYSVTSDGKVWSAKNSIWLKQTNAGTGYLSVMLSNGAQGTRRLYVHRLVAQSFLPGCPLDKPTVNHKDGNKHNNNVSNLEWASRKEQSQHLFNALGYRGPHCGESSPQSKLKAHQVAEIRGELAKGRTNSSVAQQFGVGTTTVANIRLGISWKHVE